MYFADIKFPNKDSVLTQAFAFLGSKRKHLNSHHGCHGTWIQITGKTQNEN